jgi:hypothetical protein
MTFRVRDGIAEADNRGVSSTRGWEAEPVISIAPLGFGVKHLLGCIN